MECIAADLAVDAFLHSVAENQHIKGLIQHPHHHGLGVQRAAVLLSTDSDINVVLDADGKFLLTFRN